MPAANTGRGTGLGYADESTHGTAVSRDHWRPLVSAGLQTQIEKQARPDLLVSGGSPVSGGHHSVRSVSGGPVSLLATYNSIGELLKSALGVAATSGSGPFVHTYTLGVDLPSLTLELLRGTGKSEIFEGSKINQMVLSCSPGQPMQMDLDFISETSQARGTAGTATYTTDLLILASHAGSLAFGGDTFALKSMRLTLNNNLERREKLGALESQEPNRSDFAEVILEVELDAVSGSNDTLLADHLADTQGDAVITFTSSPSIFEITVHNAYVVAASDPINGAGVISQSATLRGESDGTDLGLKIKVTNANSSASSN